MAVPHPNCSDDYTLLTNYNNSTSFSVENKYIPNTPIQEMTSLAPQDNSHIINICRICMQINQLKPIFTNNLQQSVLADKIRICAEIEISFNDGLPSNICLQCEVRFTEAFELRQQTRKSDEILRNMLFKYNSDTTFEGNLNLTTPPKSANTKDDNFHSVFLPELNIELKEEVIIDEDIDELPELAQNDVAEVIHAPFVPAPFVCPEPPQVPPLLVEPQLPVAATAITTNLKTEMSDDEFETPLSKIKAEPRHKEKSHKESRSHRKKHKKIKLEKTEDSEINSNNQKGDVDGEGVSENTTKRRRKPVKSYREVDEDEDGRAKKEKSKKSQDAPKKVVAGVSSPENSEFDVKMEIKKEQEENEDDDDGELSQDYDADSGEQKKKVKRLRTGEESCDSIVCHVCGKSNFKKASYLKRHIRDMHSQIELDCDQCDKKFSTPGSLNVHKKVVHEKRRYHCDQCNRVYITSRDLHVHTLQAHYIGDPKYECEICGAKYKHPFLLRLHKHRSKNYPTHGAGRPGQETRTTNFKCTACDIPYFDCLVSYREHRREHDNKYVCKLCGHTVTTDNLLRAHIRLHNKKYTCDLCEYKTTSMYNLQRHKISHTGVKPFPCTICDKGFTRNEQLKNHLRTHGLTGTANSGDEKLTQNALEYYNNILRYQEVLNKTDGTPVTGLQPGGSDSIGNQTPLSNTPVSTPIPTTIPIHLQPNDLQQQQQHQQTNVPINMQQLPSTTPVYMKSE